MANIKPIDQERPFKIDELFFSTTDRKGIIRSGNEVFTRISGYPADAIIGKPHNIIRHPDMPRAVFKLLWDYIGNGKSFAGYVKNMACDGTYYWVTALVVPIPDGYLSIRFKPSSPYFPVVKELYAVLRAIEASAGDGAAARQSGMAKAEAHLFAALAKLGFQSYDSFMHTLLASEMASYRARMSSHTGGGIRRTSSDHSNLKSTLEACRAVDVILDELFSRVDSFLGLIGKLDSKSAFLLTLSNKNRLTWMNALITAYRLAEEGRGLTVITHNLASVLEESSTIIAKMTGQMAALTSSLRALAFTIAAAKLQVEMAIFFLDELIRSESHKSAAAATGAPPRSDVDVLVSSFRLSIGDMLGALLKVQEPIRPLVQLHELLVDTFRRLNVVRLTGKVQAAYLSDARQFQELFERIFQQLKMAEGELEELTAGVSALEASVPQFRQGQHFLETALGAFQKTPPVAVLERPKLVGV